MVTELPNSSENLRRDHEPLTRNEVLSLAEGVEISYIDESSNTRIFAHVEANDESDETQRIVVSSLATDPRLLTPALEQYYKLLANLPNYRHVASSVPELQARFLAGYDQREPEADLSASLKRIKLLDIDALVRAQVKLTDSRFGHLDSVATTKGLVNWWGTIGERRVNELAQQYRDNPDYPELEEETELLHKKQCEQLIESHIARTLTAFKVEPVEVGWKPREATIESASTKAEQNNGPELEPVISPDKSKSKNRLIEGVLGFANKFRKIEGDLEASDDSVALNKEASDTLADTPEDKEEADDLAILHGKVQTKSEKNNDTESLSNKPSLGFLNRPSLTQVELGKDLPVDAIYESAQSELDLKTLTSIREDISMIYVIFYKLGAPTEDILKDVEEANERYDKLLHIAMEKEFENAVVAHFVQFGNNQVEHQKSSHLVEMSERLTSRAIVYREQDELIMKSDKDYLAELEKNQTGLEKLKLLESISAEGTLYSRYQKEVVVPLAWVNSQIEIVSKQVKTGKEFEPSLQLLKEMLESVNNSEFGRVSRWKEEAVSEVLANFHVLAQVINVKLPESNLLILKDELVRLGSDKHASFKNVKDLLLIHLGKTEADLAKTPEFLKILEGLNTLDYINRRGGEDGWMYGSELAA